MKRLRQGIRSTKNNEENQINNALEKDMNPDNSQSDH